jgi:aminoglycoside 3-N-acetyltransferase I
MTMQGGRANSTNLVVVSLCQGWLMKPSFTLLRLRPEHAHLVPGLQSMFGRAFDDGARWRDRRPSTTYTEKLLAKEHVIVLAALHGEAGKEQVVGGLVAYELPKIEEARSEIYIYDLAVDEAHRRRGIAAALIEALQPIAHSCGAWVIYVQADYGDEPAVALYTKLGTKEEVMHFDIAVRT